MSAQLLNAAKTLSDRLWPTSEQKLEHEILWLDDQTVAVVIDQDGIDYILTMMVVPNQRNRPRSS